MYSILLGASALLPALLLVTYFHQRDVYPEPPAVLWRTFGLGVLTVFPILLLAWPLDAIAQQFQNPLLYGLATSFLGAAIPEEFFKFLVLYFYAAKHIEFDEPMDGIVYGATASLGFAALENVLYVSEGGFAVAIVRAVLSVPGHALFGVVMGYYVAQAKFTTGDRGPLLARALGIPILLHGLYNTPLLASERLTEDSGAGFLVMLLLPLSPAIVFGGMFWARRLVHQHRGEQFAASPGGVLPPVPAAIPARVVPSPVPRADHREVFTPLPPPTMASPRTLEVRAKAPFQLVPWLMTAGGGLLATAGGLLTLLLLLGMVLEESSEDLIYGLVGLFFIGVLPFLLGTRLFFRGIGRLNEARASLP